MLMYLACVLVQYTCILVQHTCILVQHACLLVEQTSILVQHARLLVQHARLLVQHTCILVHRICMLIPQMGLQLCRGREFVVDKLCYYSRAQYPYVCMCQVFTASVKAFFAQPITSARGQTDRSSRY